MAKIRRSFTVDKPPTQVVDYLKDFSHAAHWDPGTLACTPLDPGPVREGSRWHNVSQFLGRRAELNYRLERAQPDRLTFVGENDAARSVDDLTFEPAGAGTRVTYQADIRLLGAARFADPIVRLALARMAGAVVAQMREVINAL
jgi:carbon monoxide dehydrogenase subunit G